MSVLLAIMLAALTRAEIIERFRAPVLLQVDGLVQVLADCPADMRREFQSPVAGFVSGVCRKHYAGGGVRPRRFAAPGIIVHIEDGTAADTNLTVRVGRRDDGSRFTRLYLHSPGYTDAGALRLATVRAFYLACTGEEIDAEEAARRLRVADPQLTIAEEYAELAAWRSGERGFADDERYLRLMRSVLEPGVAHPEDVLTFASRLYLYPPQFDLRFAGTHHECSFREAIALAATDPCVRYAAYLKRDEVMLYGGGRGEDFAAAADAYCDFLTELARYRKSPAELELMLDEAEDRLKGVLE